MTPLLVAVAQAAPIVDQTGWSPLMVFVYALVVQVGPWIVAVVGLVTVYLKLRSVEKGIDGRMSQLIETSRQAAKAEGVVEGITEVAPKVGATTPAPTVVQVVHDARPGGRRRLDPPSTPPPESDPSSHQR